MAAIEKPSTTADLKMLTSRLSGGMVYGNWLMEPMMCSYSLIFTSTHAHSKTSKKRKHFHYSEEK